MLLRRRWGLIRAARMDSSRRCSAKAASLRTSRSQNMLLSSLEGTALLQDALQAALILLLLLQCCWHPAQCQQRCECCNTSAPYVLMMLGPDLTRRVSTATSVPPATASSCTHMSIWRSRWEDGTCTSSTMDSAGCMSASDCCLHGTCVADRSGRYCSTFKPRQAGGQQPVFATHWVHSVPQASSIGM